METAAKAELAARKTGGVEVALYWNRATDELTISVYDAPSGGSFELPVAPDRALDAFYHPYAHAACTGIEYASPLVKS